MGRIKDSTGNLLNIPILNKPTNEVQPDSIRFNFKTKSFNLEF
jgi:hypothetical protein